MTDATIMHVDKLQMQMLDSLLFDGNKRVLPLSSHFYYKHVDLHDLRCWCFLHARYGVPTQELIDWLLKIIAGRKAIEIGAGMGDLGYRLGIPMTDSYQQVTDPPTQLYMQAFKQVPTTPPPDVMKADAQTAVLRFKPQVVIGSWITERYMPGSEEGNMHGPREDILLKNCETYIIIGNEKIHGRKRILSLPHETYHFPWLISRASEPAKNVIYVWNK